LGCVFLEIATVIQGRTLDEFADFRARPRKILENDSDDDSYHGNPGNIEEWIQKLRPIADQGLIQGQGMSWKLDIIREMLNWDAEDRPTASKVLERLGGPRDCCLQEREVYEAEEV